MMNIKFFFLILFCGVVCTNSRKILTQSLNHEELSNKLLLTIDLIPKEVLNLVDTLRSFSPFQIISLARFVNNGDLSPRLLTATDVMKSLTSGQLQMIKTRVNINQLPKNITNNLNYLIFLNDAEKQKINSLKDKNYLTIFDLTKDKFPRHAFSFNPTEKNFIKLFNLFYQMEPENIETIIILRDMETLPANILEHISVIKSMDQNEFYQSIHNIKSSAPIVEKTLSEIKSYDSDQVNLIFKFNDLNNQQLNFLYSLAFLNLIPPEQLNIIIHQFNLKNDVRNIIDLLVEFKILPHKVIENIKSFSQMGIVSVVISNALEHLEKISLHEINHLIYDLGLSVHLTKYLPPFLSSKLQNLVKVLRNFDSKKLLKLSQYANDGIISSYLITAASILGSLSPEQMENIAKQQKLNHLPRYVLEIFEHFRKLSSAEYKLINSINHLKINDISFPNQTYSKTSTKNDQFLTNRNGCFESKTMTIVTTKTFVPVNEFQKCVPLF
ncbi:hypothetical protein BpHYR1_032909 [Brachionus plicatilis]|uniref:Uncharacterized protein n=1 Tax=Brachionus plicatilis TaxID=10195 RepID=A0A3M7T5A9_BRAPC|nr:hypothetical protein BpHYR1_032909 [Brachionus plicatilis]